MSSQPTDTGNSSDPMGSMGPMGPDPNAPFDPLTQIITIVIEPGVPEMMVPVSLSDIADVNRISVSSAIDYGSQIGACLMMLVVVLLLTARNRFSRLPTILNICALALTVIRTVLLALYFNSTYMQPYTFYSGDVTFVDANDTRISIAATALSIPQILLIEMALFVQAWSMLQLWPRLWKWSTAAASVVLCVVVLAFKSASVHYQIRIITEPFFPPLWIRQVELALTTTMIVWFCVVFNVRLVTHMVTNRSILPTTRGLTAMEVLVMTNGILMIVPVMFAGMQYTSWKDFQAGSLVPTSVVLVLPLGVLVAQSLTANPTIARGTHGSDDGTMNSKRGFLGNYSHRSRATATTTSRNRAAPKVTTKVEGGVLPGTPNGTQHKADPIDLELQMIDDGDLEKAQHHKQQVEGGVRVNRSVERQEERL